jgi:hypothetical protein
MGSPPQTKRCFVGGLNKLDIVGLPHFALDSQQPYAEVVAEWEGSWQRPVNGSGNPTGAWTLAPGASSGIGNTGWVATVAYHLGLDRLTRVCASGTHWYLFTGTGVLYACLLRRRRTLLKIQSNLS